MYSTPYCPIWCGYEVIIVEIMNVGRSNHGGNNGERGGGVKERRNYCIRSYLSIIQRKSLEINM